MTAVLNTARRSASSTASTAALPVGRARSRQSATTRQAPIQVAPIQLAAVRKLATPAMRAPAAAGDAAVASGLRRLRHAAEVTGSAIMLLGFLVLALFG